MVEYYMAVSAVTLSCTVESEKSNLESGQQAPALFTVSSVKAQSLQIHTSFFLYCTPLLPWNYFTAMVQISKERPVYII